jgi:hypothetical protein
VAAWVEELQEKHGVSGVKQQLAAVRMLFDWLITGQVGVASLTICASCLGPLTGEASCGRMETVANAAAPDTAMRRPPCTTADLFLMAIAPFQN